MEEFLSNSLSFDYETADEANNLLQNGILIETTKGLVCMSVNDALSSDLNLSAEQLQVLAAQLLSLQTGKTDSDSTIPKRNFNSDSDGFSSECSDVCSTSSSVHTMVPPKSVSFTLNKMKSDSSEKATGSSELSAASNVSDSDVSGSVVNSASESTSSSRLSEGKSLTEDHKPPKRRGGWPKGRKRKPELLNLPPKAPATGYNLYLNEQRKFYKGSALAFHEITKIIGNRWSNLSLEEKTPYLVKAEEDKKRYKEELKTYRQSDAYRAYLAKKRMKRLQNNVLSESDMDATDEIDEEDNEELYCRTCDQWFHNLHNKREHLQGKQHIQSVAGDIKKELESDADSIPTNTTSITSLAEPNVDAVPGISGSPLSVTESIVNLITVVTKREREMKILENRLRESILSHDALCQQLSQLREREKKLQNDMLQLKQQEKEIEDCVFQLWKVPSLFVVTDFNDFNTCPE